MYFVDFLTESFILLCQASHAKTLATELCLMAICAIGGGSLQALADDLEQIRVEWKVTFQPEPREIGQVFRM
jgi:hypothetical protein